MLTGPVSTSRLHTVVMALNVLGVDFGGDLNVLVPALQNENKEVSAATAAAAAATALSSGGGTAAIGDRGAAGAAGATDAVASAPANCAADGAAGYADWAAVVRLPPPCEEEQLLEISCLPNYLQSPPPQLAGLIPVNGCPNDLENAAAVVTERSKVSMETPPVALSCEILGEYDGHRSYDNEDDPTNEIYSLLGEIPPTKQDLQCPSLCRTANHIRLSQETREIGMAEKDLSAGCEVVGSVENFCHDLHHDGEGGPVHDPSQARLAAPTGSGLVAALTDYCAALDATQRDVILLQLRWQQLWQQQQQHQHQHQQQQQQQQLQQQQQQQEQEQLSEQMEQVTTLLLSLTDSFIQSSNRACTNTGVDQPTPAMLETFFANLPSTLPATLPSTTPSTRPITPFSTLPFTLPSNLPPSHPLNLLEAPFPLPLDPITCDSEPLATTRADMQVKEQNRLPSALDAQRPALTTDLMQSYPAVCASEPLRATSLGALVNMLKRPAFAMDAPLLAPPAQACAQATDQACSGGFISRWNKHRPPPLHSYTSEELKEKVRLVQQQQQKQQRQVDPLGSSSKFQHRAIHTPTPAAAQPWTPDMPLLTGNSPSAAAMVGRGMQEETCGAESAGCDGNIAAAAAAGAAEVAAAAAAVKADRSSDSVAAVPATLPASPPASPSAALSDSGACISQPLTATTSGMLKNMRKRPASAMDEF
ncbi:unnamed protein product [Closterium sp. NIES-54]